MSELQEMEEFNQRIKKRLPKLEKTTNRVGKDVRSDESVPCGELSGNIAMWAVSGRAYRPCETAVNALPAAIYSVRANEEMGIYFERQIQSYDNLMHLPDSASAAVIENIRAFWARESAFREYGFLWKRGILLWGPPGGGKTCTLQLIAREMVERGGTVIYADGNPLLVANGLKLLRQIEPDRPLVVMLEDLDAITDRYGEADLLALLDGEMQIDNVVFIATTNYPELLDRRIINRPSRFDIVRKIGMPTAPARRVYLAAKNKRFQAGDHADEIREWVQATDGFSIAHLKELIILVEVFGMDFDKAVTQLRTMINASPSSADEGRQPLGFMSEGQLGNGNAN